jgi:membrane protein
MRDDLTRIGKHFLADVKRDDVSGLAAELAYRFLFAIFPFGIFVAALTAFIAPMLGFKDPTGQILGAIGDNLPADVASGIKPQLEAVIGTTRPGLLTIGAVAALWAATGGTNALIKAMNRAYEVEETRSFIPKTARAVGLTLLASVGLLGAFVTIVGASLLTAEVAGRLNLDPGVVTAIGLLRWPVVFAGLSLAVAALYKLAPNFRAPWRWCVAGGAIFSVGWLIATAAFGFYVANFGSYANTYGALGGVIVLMLWFYLSAMVLVGSAALMAAAMKELEPETFAAGQAPAKAAAAEKARAERGEGSPEGVAGAPGRGSAEPTSRGPSVLPRTATLAPIRQPRSPELSGPLEWAATGVAIAAGVAVGALAARLFDGPDR